MQGNEQPPELNVPEQSQNNTNQEAPLSPEEIFARFQFLIIKQALVGNEPTEPVWVLPEPHPRTENSQP